MLNASAADIVSIANVDDLFWYVARNIVGRLNFADCVIYQANEDQTLLTQVAAWGEKNPYGRTIINPLVIPFGGGITGRVAQTREAVIIDDLRDEETYIPDLQPARSEICVPLMFRSRVMGVIDSEHPEPDAFGEAEREILGTVAAITSAKLQLLEEAELANRRYHFLSMSHAQLAADASNRKALESGMFEQRKREAVGRLAGSLAHEINNLLTVMSGNLELLELSGLPLEVSEELRDAQFAGTRMAQVIRDMLSFAQRANLKAVTTDLNILVTDCLEKNGQLPDGAPDLALAGDLWPVSVDRKGMETALLNLVENAQDAVKGGGSIKITTENIACFQPDGQSFATDLLPGPYVRLTVTDTGVGMPQDRLSRIFDPFFTTKPMAAGKGMGLPVVMGFMQQSGGAVAVSSKEGQGSAFHLYLPVALPD
jgi:signal transduction histidine kinase